ncbi:MAG: hypothetical protein ABFD52_08910 [Acidobacteriota bacterium]
MKKFFAALAVVFIAAALVFFMPLAALAQETTTVSIFGVEIDVSVVDAVVSILAGGIVTLIVQFLKKKIKFIGEGVGAFFFTIFTTGAVTAIYFLLLHPMHPWEWLKYAVYAGAILGESTGWFHLYKKATGTPSTPAV